MKTQLFEYCLKITNSLKVEHRTRSLMGLGMLFMVGQLSAQIVLNKVSTVPSGAVFYVDGTPYTSAQNFLWQTGTKHILQINSQADPTGTTRYIANGWSDPTQQFSASSNTVTITANAVVAEYKSIVIFQYRVDLFLFNYSGDPANRPASACGYPGTPAQPFVNNPGVQFPGVVYVGGQCYDTSQTIWADAGSSMTLAAYPFPGFVFQGWSVNANAPSAFVGSILVKGPTVLNPRFAPGKRVTFYTSPPELQVRVDGTNVNTLVPGTISAASKSGIFDFGDGQEIVLGAPSPQRDLQQTLWVFDSFDIGGGQNTVYKVNNVNISSTITARFKKGISVSIATNPPNLKVSIDGRDNWPSQDFAWAAGSKHSIAAPAQVTDSRDRKLNFTGWSHGGDAAQELVLPAEVPAAGGIRWTANYQMLPRLTVSMAQAGIRLQLDGVDCLAPCSIDKPSGSSVSIAASSVLALGDGVRYEFQGWNDGVATPSRNIQFANEDIRIGASYRTMNRLVAVSDPAEGAAFQFNPPSVDGFYSSDTQVTVTADTLKGFRFRRWEGDLQGTFRTASISMNAVHTVRAALDKVAFVAEAGVRNSAGETPIQAVSAGSIISIYGEGLGTETLVGGVNPVPQTLGGITVRWNNRFLPLIFVSPQQINAFLPAEAEPGDQTLFIRLANQQDIASTFKVARNAPGLFAFFIDSTGYAVAVHENGKPITPDSPAKKGETITLFGTGFGPLLRPVPEGFTVPEGILYGVADKVELVAGEYTAPAASSVAATGMIGTIASLWKIAPEFPSGAAVQIKVRVNGQDSNNVLLPVE